MNGNRQKSVGYNRDIRYIMHHTHSVEKSLMNMLIAECEVNNFFGNLFEK